MLLSIAVVFALISSGIHTFVCLIVGYFWCYWVYFDLKPTSTQLRNVKFNNGRLSFLNFINFSFDALNKFINKRNDIKIAFLLRQLSPHILFLLFWLALGVGYQWYFVFLGSLAFEATKNIKTINELKEIKSRFQF